MEEEEEGDDDLDSVMNMEEGVGNGEDLNPRDKERLKLYLKEVIKVQCMYMYMYRDSYRGGSNGVFALPPPPM